MKIQRFRAKTTQEALEQARIALGPEALILQTRRVPASGLERLVSRPLVEVLAAVDTGPPPGTARSQPQSASKPAAEVAQPGSAAWQSELAALRREVVALRKIMVEQSLRQSQPYAPGTAGRSADGSVSGLSEVAAREAMAERLLSGLATRPIEIKEGECTVVALVGPTGVGKTTTIAKLAAVAARVERKRVALIAADTYRIGAVEQLQTYAQLLDVPMTVAYGPEDVRAAREQYAGLDLVFMDTVGRSPGNRDQLEELAELVATACPDEVHLALDARGSYATQQSVLRGFRPLCPTQLLLSKLDEAPRLEDSLTAVLEGGLPLSYLTTGQRVPEDLAAADGAHLAAWLLGGA